MGKRSKAAKPQGPKKKQPLPQNFQCLFCNHESSVTVRLDRKAGVGSLSCKVCGQNYQTNINFLSEGVDVYTDWIDACEAVASGRAPPAEVRAAQPKYRGTARDKSPPEPKPGAEDRYEGDDFVVDDEGDMEGEGAYRAGADDDDD